MVRLNATIVARVSSFWAPSGIFSSSLSSPTHKNLPSSHFVSSSSRKSRIYYALHPTIDLAQKRKPAGHREFCIFWCVLPALRSSERSRSVFSVEKSDYLIHHNSRFATVRIDRKM